MRPCEASGLCIRRTPHPVIVTIRDNEDYIRVLLCSYYTTITGWGVLLSYAGGKHSVLNTTWRVSEA